MEREIILTGYGEEEFTRKPKNREEVGCILCGKAEGERIICFTGDGIHTLPTSSKLLDIKIGDIKYSFPLCWKCLILFMAFSELTDNLRVKRKLKADKPRR